MTDCEKAYAERDRLVAALSKIFPSHLARHPASDERWEDDWRWIVFIDLPTGQVSWHVHDSELPWFNHLDRRDDGSWDGHTTEEKYERLEKLPPALVANARVMFQLLQRVEELETELKHALRRVQCLQTVIELYRERDAREMNTRTRLSSRLVIEVFLKWIQTTYDVEDQPGENDLYRARTYLEKIVNEAPVLEEPSTQTLVKELRSEREWIEKLKAALKLARKASGDEKVHKAIDAALERA